MRLDLLSDLESCSRKSWLWHYRENLVNNSINKKDSSKNLFQLTKARLKQISSSTNSTSGKHKIIIVESEPIKFLAGFLAGVITEADLFLGDPNWQQQEWQQVLKLVQPDLLFGEEETKKLITKQNIDTRAIKQKADFPQALIMIPTGGSSGKIKFAMHTWSTLSASVVGFQNYFNCQEINSFCTLPLYHVSGLMQFMRSFITQGNLIICSYNIVKTQQILFNKQDYFISLVPTQLQLLIELIPEWLVAFKTILLGGAPASRSLLERAIKYRLPLAPTYGMTETASQIVTLKPQDFLAGNDSSGRVLPHAKIVIKSENNRDKNNNIGLINISCNSLCLGYYPQVFSKSHSFITDDLGYVDDEGYLYLIGRNSQKIITGGENVFPTEVEAVILATNLVRDVCVVGISDRHWGQAVTAVYVPLESDFNLNLVKEKIKLQLAKYKQPKNWIEVDSLPRNNRGKINYQQIKAIAVGTIRESLLKQ